MYLNGRAYTYAKMAVFKCPMCGYVTDRVSNLKVHIFKRTLCPPTVSEDSLEDLKIKYCSQPIKGISLFMN